MPWGVAVAAGVSALGSAYAANQGANAQTSASNNAIAEENKMYGANTANEQPYMNAGSNAVNLENQYLNGNYSGFLNSPDYTAAFSQGMKALDAGAAAGGNLWGGGTSADAIQYGQGLATQYANNYWNKISGVAGQGLSATNALAGVGTNTANQIAGQYNNIGQANASSYASEANSANNLVNQGANLYGQYMNSSSYGGGTGYTMPSINVAQPSSSVSVPNISQNITPVSF
jgi:hypothetical protein